MAFLGIIFGIFLFGLLIIALIFIGIASLLLAPFRAADRKQKKSRAADKDLLETIQCPYCGLYVAERPRVVNGLCGECGKAVGD